MGRNTKAAIAEREQKEQSFRTFLSSEGRKANAKAAQAGALIDNQVMSQIKPYLQRAWRGSDSFKPKTRSSRVERRVLEMARHLFGKHPVPPILWQAWESQGARSGIDSKDWFVSVGLGQSFLKTCAKGILTRREAHLFLACPHGLSIEQALFWSVSRSQGAADGIALRIARSKLATQEFNDFWRGVARFMADNPPDSAAEAGDFCDYLAWRRGQDRTFEVFGHGFTAVSMRARMVDWHRDMARAKALGFFQWAGAEISNRSYSMEDAHGNAALWRFEQILESKALAAEGNAMRHCVLSYKHSCMSGHCSIWSLKSGPDEFSLERKLTIEVNTATGRIVQARGLANRAARPAESKALRRWASDCGFRLDMF